MIDLVADYGYTFLFNHNKSIYAAATINGNTAQINIDNCSTEIERINHPVLQAGIQIFTQTGVDGNFVLLAGVYAQRCYVVHLSDQLNGSGSQFLSGNLYLHDVVAVYTCAYITIAGLNFQIELGGVLLSNLVLLGSVNNCTHLSKVDVTHMCAEVSVCIALEDTVLQTPLNCGFCPLTKSTCIIVVVQVICRFESKSIRYIIYITINDRCYFLTADRSFRKILITAICLISGDNTVIICPSNRIV